MSIFQAFILGIIQGITEFLPISSSGHLVLFEGLFGLEIENLKSFDVALHIGTLVAILVYFWRDFWGIILGIFGKSVRYYRELLFYIIIGTIPAVIAGVFFEDAIDSLFRDPKMIGAMMILVGIVFFGAEKWPSIKEKTNPGLRGALIIGLAQAFALIPGISRSGFTISAGLFQGLKREESARFAFLLGAPAIFGAGLWTILNKTDSPVTMSLSNGNLGLSPFLIGFLASALSSLLAIKFLMKFLKKHTLKSFGVYLIVLGIIISKNL